MFTTDMTDTKVIEMYTDLISDNYKLNEICAFTFKCKWFITISFKMFYNYFKPYYKEYSPPESVDRLTCLEYDAFITCRQREY